MPWTPSDALRHTKKADTAEKQKKWASVANNARDEYLKRGYSERAADAEAVRIANGVIARKRLI